MYFLQNKFFSVKIVKPALYLLCFFFTSQSIHAQSPSKKQQTIDIKAQYLLLDDKKGVSKYKGNVIFTKGSLIIKADAITLFYNGEKLTKALITGYPADVQHQPDNEAKVHSQAKKMEFFVKEERLVLKGQAFVNQGKRHFSGEYIEYDTQQRIISAAGSKGPSISIKGATENLNHNQSNNRVHVIIGPKDDNKPDENKDKIKNE